VPISSRTRWVKRHQHRRVRPDRARLLSTLAATLPFVFGLVAILVLTTARPATPRARAAATLQQMANAASFSAPKAARPARLVYQYSVIPGGVQDVHELSQAVAHDPDVALHYADFNFRRARVVRLLASQKMYMSYRRHGRILWTKTPHLILAGEEVITDGKVSARKRCGNRLASKPEGLVAPDEPSESQLNQPVAIAGDPVRPPMLLAQNSPLMPPLVANGPVGPGPIGIPIVVGPVIGGGGGSTCETAEQEAREHDHDKNELICPKKPHKPPPPVPEPATYLLMGSGVLLLAYQFRTRRN